MINTPRAAHRRRSLRTVAVAVATATVVLVPISATGSAGEVDATGVQPQNSIGIRLVDVPTDRIDDPRALSSIVDHVAPGARITRAFDIVSTIDQPVEVEVYGGNAVIRDGVFRPLDTDGPGIADWISASENRVTLAARETRTLELAIDVPSSAPSGEFYGALWVEPPESGGEVSVTNRVGMRIYLSVGLGGEPPVDFAIGSMTAGRDADGVPYVATDLRNTGGRALDITGTLSLSEGPAGLDAGPFPFDGAITLLPGDIEPLRIRLDPELPDGPWTARLDARSGLLERSAVGEVHFPSEAGEAAPPAESETIAGTDAEGNDISEEIRNQRRTLLPLAAIMILLALGALYMMLVWKRREEEEEDEPVTAAAAAGQAEAGTGEDETS